MSRVDPYFYQLERLQYGFDRDSRRTWRRRCLTTGEDNAYAYDGLSQVTQSAVGNLNLNETAISGVPASTEAWNYDPTGNWQGYRTETDGSLSLDQHRIHDKGNRLTQIQDDPRPILLDRAGRMRQVPPDASGNWNESLQIQWDAWSRITQIKRASDGSILGAYTYDGQTRRLTRTVSSVMWHSYYSDAWRPLEERKNAQTSAARQYYWGSRHRDDLTRQDRATTDGGDLEEIRYVLMDYYSPASITDETGAITERYAFSAFGVRRILEPDFAPRNTSESEVEFAYHGQFLDSKVGFLNYGYRYYSPTIGRWLSKEPLPHNPDLNAYLFTRNNPINKTDFLGLWTIEFKGDNWSAEQKAAFTAVYQQVANDVPKMQTRLIFITSQAQKISDECCFKKELLNSLNGFKVLLNDINNKLKTPSMILPVYLKDLGDDYAQAEFNRLMWIFDGLTDITFRHMSVNENRKLEPETLFHELSHISGTTDENDAGYLWNAFNIEEAFSGADHFTLSTFLYTLKTKRGTKGCSSTDLKWPEN